MKSQAYFEYLCWDLRHPLNWEAADVKTQKLSLEIQVKVAEAIDVIRMMTQRSFNEGADNASAGNLAMTMETRCGPPYFGEERDWNDLSAGFAAITFMKEHYADILDAVGFVTKIKIQGGYFEVRKHLEGQYPIGDKLLREHSKLFS